MRILAVRGQNLASLAEPFAIELGAEPLAGAGLFAITGETGAGKSTLLDAICLALYGEFPRLGPRSIAAEDIPDAAEGDALKPWDARSILRRGAASAWAEVDFLGVDGRSYRARWSAYRARNKPGGRLQPAARQIDRLGPSGEAVETVADKATAVDQRVVELTDLTFGQFRRTVVLAQGDFDAFLRADDKERADLLEKITGTEIYALLSARAFDKARAARDAVAVLEARRRDIGLLAPEVLAERQAHRTGLAERLAASRVRADAARTDLARHDRIAAAVARLAEADAEATAADAAREAASEMRDRLDRITRARSLGPAFAALADVESDEAAAIAALAQAESDLAVATPNLERARERRDAALAALAAVDARIVDLTPQWDAAAALDVRIAEARREADEAEAPRRAAREARDAEAARLEAIDARRLGLAAEVARLRHDLARLADLAPLAARWEDVEARLGERIDTAGEARVAAERRRAAERRLTELARRLAAADEAEAADAGRRGEVEARLIERVDALAALDEAGVRTRDGAAAEVESDIAAAIPPATARRAARADMATAERDAAAAAAGAREIAERRAAIEGARDTARARRDGLSAAADLADAVTSAEARRLRDRLVEGEPCPVCGSRDHPVAADPRIVAALEKLRTERMRTDEEIADFDRRAADLDGALAAAEARHAEAGHRRRDADDRHTTAEAALADCLARLAIAADRLGLAADFEAATEDPVVGLTDFAATVKRLRRRHGEALEQAGRLRREIDGLRRDRDRLAADRETRRAARHDDEIAAADLRSDAATAAEIEDGARRRLVDLDARLAPLLGALEIGSDDLARDERALVDHLARAVADHRDKAAAVARAVEEGNDLERARHVAREVSIRAEETAIAAEAKLAERRQTVDRLVGERASLLGGVATTAHRDAVSADRTAAAAALDEAQRALDLARTAHETVLALHGERHAALIAAQDEVRHRAHLRDHALAASDLSLDQAARLLAIPAQEIESLKIEVAAIDRRATRAHAAQAERRRDLTTALADGRPALDVDALGAALATARAEGEGLNREIGALDQMLAADDAARVVAAGMDREITAARTRHEVLAAVNQAIGSSDGDKFRRFAQGITLDRLTELANRHLASLNPRYRLARAEGLGLTIVDRDMGDEVRSTRSLSGGERFLASLALALALSGLEGRRSFVDTLFVDEGFGSLDAATLDVAIDALEGLQSEGRKVGVISHVAAMHDRIPVQIRVEKAGAGRSRVRVVGGG